jgi:hypothetical protein
MGGQDGFARDQLTYNSESNVLMGGIKFKPTEKFYIGLYLTNTDSTAGLDAFDLSAPDYVATHPPTSYDFSMTHTYSDLDTSRLDAQVKVHYKLGASSWVSGVYRRAEFTDDAPYLYDTDGALDIFTFAYGMSF